MTIEVQDSVSVSFLSINFPRTLIIGGGPGGSRRGDCQRKMERTPVTDPSLRTGGSEPAWTQLPQLNSGVCVCCLALAYFLVFGDMYLHAHDYSVQAQRFCLPPTSGLLWRATLMSRNLPSSIRMLSMPRASLWTGVCESMCMRAHARAHSHARTHTHTTRAHTLKYTHTHTHIELYATARSHSQCKNAGTASYALHTNVQKHLYRNVLRALARLLETPYQPPHLARTNAYTRMHTTVGRLGGSVQLAMIGAS